MNFGRSPWPGSAGAAARGKQAGEATSGDEAEPGGDGPGFQSGSPATDQVPPSAGFLQKAKLTLVSRLLPKSYIETPVHVAVAEQMRRARPLAPLSAPVTGLHPQKPTCLKDPG